MKQLNWTLLAILGVAALLRFIQLDAHSLWYDEAFAVLFAEKGLSAMLYGTLAPVQGGASDIHPLLYYVTLNGWMTLFGQTAFIVRLWSVILGVLTVGMVYTVARRIFSQPSTAYAAALITALMPFHVHYSQETRMYSLLALLLLLTTYFYLRAVRYGDADSSANPKPLWGWWFAFGVGAGLAMYTQQLAAFYLMALGVLPLFSRRRAAAIGVVFGVVVALVVYAPWLVNLPAQLQKVNSYYWVQQPDVGDFMITLYLFLTNYGELPAPNNLIGLGVAFAILLLVGLQLLMLTRQRAPDKRGVGMVVWLFAVPMLLMWLVSQIQPVFLERSLIASAVMLYVLLGWFVTYRRVPLFIRGLVGVGLLVNVGIGLAYQYSLGTFPYSPMREVVEYVRTNQIAGDVVVHQNKLSALPAVFYGRDLPQRYLGDIAGSPQDTLALPTQEVLGLWADACIAAAANNAGRVWFIVYARAEAEYAASGQPELQAAFDWLNTHYTLAATHPISDVTIYLFAETDGAANTC